MRTGSSPTGAALAGGAGARLPLPAGNADASEDILAGAVVRALAYADVFDCPLTAREVHRYLDRPATPAEVALALAAAAEEGAIERDGDVYTLPGRSDLAGLRRRRALAAAALWPLALRYGRALGGLPFVRMVAVSGALAVDNVTGDADVDYLVVTEPDRLWLARGLVIGVVRLAARRDLELCPNYVLSERALVLDDRDLFTAHELAQMVPLHGLDVYAAMRHLNGWTAGFLPNASGPPRAVGPGSPRGGPVRRVAEGVLRTRLGARVERWEATRKIRRFSAAPGGDEVRFTADECKGHFAGYRERILEEYDARLDSLGVP